MVTVVIQLEEILCRVGLMTHVVCRKLSMLEVFYGFVIIHTLPSNC